MSTLSQKGFTAVELMVVIVVMAILIAVAAPSLFGTINKSKATATTNELLGLIEFARNTAKSTNKAVSLSKCTDTESCGLKVTLLGNETNTAISPLRIINKSDIKNVTYVGNKTTVAFYPDGTRGLHVSVSSIKGFNDDGAFDRTAKTIASAQALGDFIIKVKNDIYCREITVNQLGSVKVATEGCTP